MNCKTCIHIHVYTNNLKKLEVVYHRSRSNDTNIRTAYPNG